MRLRNLYKLETITDRAKYRFSKDAKDAYLDTLIIGIADFMATRKSSLDDKKVTSFLKFVSHLIDYYYQEFPKSRFKALLNGNEVMETLHIKSGKKVGELLALIENAEREGTISNREEAVKLITSKYRMEDR
jgi:tRNA nucleotidyltransferase/poly(A) polymerase